jgi:hypothetical protein
VHKLLPQSAAVLEGGGVAGQILDTGGIGAVCGLESVTAAISVHAIVARQEDEARLLHRAVDDNITVQFNSLGLICNVIYLSCIGRISACGPASTVRFSSARFLVARISGRRCPVDVRQTKDNSL